MEPGELPVAEDASPAATDPLAFLLFAESSSSEGALDNGTVDRGAVDRSILDLGIELPQIERPRPLLDGVALALAIVVAPLGLIAGIVASVVSSRRLGYVSALAKASVVVAIVMCFLLACGGVASAFYASDRAHEAALTASSKQMCALIAAKPGVLQDTAFGWPSLTSTIPAYVSAVASYEKWWAHLASVAPKPIRSQVAAVSTAAAANASRLRVSRVVDQQQDYADIQRVAASSTLPKWVSTYCG
jgi:hypothetical protein